MSSPVNLNQCWLIVTKILRNIPILMVFLFVFLLHYIGFWMWYGQFDFIQSTIVIAVVVETCNVSLTLEWVQQVKYKNALSPLLMHWRYSSLALNHWYISSVAEKCWWFIRHSSDGLYFICSIQICEICHQTFGPSHQKCPTCLMIFVNWTLISLFRYGRFQQRILNTSWLFIIIFSEDTCTCI